MSKKVFKISKTASITVALTSGLIALGNIGLLAYRDNLTELMLTTNTVSVTTLMVFIYLCAFSSTWNSINVFLWDCTKTARGQRS